MSHMQLPPKIEKNQKIIDLVSRTKGLYHIGPYTTTNGCTMGVYSDMRSVFSDPKRLRSIALEIWKFMKRKKIKADFIVGGATAGIQLSTALSMVSGVPNGYVRKEPKAGGLCRAVEGEWKKGMRCVLIEDAHGHGAAKTVFIKNIRQAGMKIEWVIVMLSRSNKHAHYFKWFPKAGVKFQSFGDIEDFIIHSKRKKLISSEAAQLMMYFHENAYSWNKDPKKWKFFLDYKKRWQNGEFKKYYHKV